MNKEYSDSLYPFGIGTSFIITLLSIMLGGALIGVFLEQGSFLKQSGGGIILLIIFLVILVGPIIYNKRVSRFEKGRTVLKKLDDIGIIQGLRGALFRLVLYEEGLEIRAFYHRYYIPFARIDGVSIEKGYFSKRLNIVAKIEGVPDYIVSSNKQLLEFALFVESKIRSNKANSADAKSRAADLQR